MSWEVGKGTECRPSCCHRDPQVGPSPLEGAWVPLPGRAFPSRGGLGALARRALPLSRGPGCPCQEGPSPLEGAWVPLPGRAFPGGYTSGSSLGALPWSPNRAGQLDGERGPPSPPPSVHTEKSAGRGGGSCAGGEAAHRRATHTATTPETSGHSRGKNKIVKLEKRKERLGHQGS